MQISELEIEQSSIDQKTADNSLIPDLRFNASRMHKSLLDSAQRNNPAGINSTLAYSLKLTQDYPGLGRLPSIERKISRLRTEIRNSLRESLKQSVLRELTRIFFRLVRDQELIKIHKTDLTLIAELLKVAKLNLEVGLVLQNDILRIEVEELNSNSQIVEAQNSFHDLLFDLASILDLESPELISLELPAGLRFSTKDQEADNLVNEIFEVDLDIKIAETDIDIIRQTIRAARSAHLPTLTLDSTYNYGSRIGPLKDTKDLTTTFVLSTSVYDSGDIENRVRKAQNSLKMAELRLRHIRNDKRSAIEKALADYTEAISRIGFAEKMIEQSFENMRIVFVRYQEGASSIVELIDAQRLLTISGQTAVKAYYDERERLAEILLLTHNYEELYNLDQNPSELALDFLLSTLNIGDFQ